MKFRISLSFFLLSMISCVSDKTVPDPQELLRKELHTIDWTKVDEYPSVSACDSLVDKEENKICFFNSVTKEFKEKMLQDTLVTQIKGLNEMNILVTVTKDAEVLFECAPEDSVRYNVSYLNSLVKNKNENFTKIHPALKRGIPVTTKFVLPITLQ